MNNVSFQGEHGAYSESAAKKFFGKEIDTIPCNSFKETLKITEEDKVVCPAKGWKCYFYKEKHL